MMQSKNPKKEWKRKHLKNFSDIDNDLIKLFKQNKTNIFVVGLGGAGNNTISRLNEIGIEGATTITVNTDAQDLFYSQSSKKILLGKQTCGGLGVVEILLLVKNVFKKQKMNLEMNLKAQTWYLLPVDLVEEQVLVRKTNHC